MRERDIFDAALAIADPALRSAYLAEASAGNEKLRNHIEGLLAKVAELGSFLEMPGIAPSEAWERRKRCRKHHRNLSLEPCG